MRKLALQCGKRSKRVELESHLALDLIATYIAAKCNESNFVRIQNLSYFILVFFFLEECGEKEFFSV